MKKYIVIDAGTSSLRVALMNEKYEILYAEVKKRTADVLMDAENEWRIIFEMMCSISRREKNIAGITATSLLGWVGMKSDGTAVTPCYTYMHQCIPEYKKYCDSNSERTAYKIARRRMNAESAVFKIQHLQNDEKEVYEKMSCFTTLKDFINAKLTGVFAIDHTFAGYTLLYDVERAEWSDELIDFFGVDRRTLPKLYRPYEVIGTLKKELCMDMGLPEGVPVVAGSVDGSTGILGAGGVKPGSAVSVIGTTDVFFMVHENISEDETMGLVTNPHVVPGLWISGGPMGIYGGTLEWITKKLLNENLTMNQINEKSMKLDPGSEGLMFFPTLTGERTPFWNPMFRGSIIGLRQKHGIEHMFRAVMEADGYTVRNIAEKGRNAGINFEKVIVLGGGSKNDLWNQMKADIMGVDHYRSSALEATMTGACMLAMMATGKDVNELEEIPMIKEYKVDKAKNLAYQEEYTRFMKVHDELAELYNYSNK